MDRDTLHRRARLAHEVMAELADEHGPPTAFATVPHYWPDRVEGEDQDPSAPRQDPGHSVPRIRRDTSVLWWWDVRPSGRDESASEVCPGLEDGGLFA